MAVLIVTATTDFSNTDLTDITEIRFQSSGSAPIAATFSMEQFGAGLISETVLVTGDANLNTINVRGSDDLDIFSAEGWQFANWSPTDLIRLDGGNTRDVLDGTNQSDQFTSAAVNDAMDGHAGADTFIIDTGEIDDDRLLIINGGSDVDVIRFVGPDVYNLNKHSINGIEKLELASADVSVVLDVEDIGGFKISEIDGSAGAQSVTIRGRVIDLSSFAFSDWDNADLVSLAGINGKSNSLTGADLKDKLSGTGNSDDVMTGGLGADILIGGGGDDRFRYFAASEAVSGESISGGVGADEIELFNVGNIDFSAASISGVETLDFGNGINTAVFSILGSFVAVDGGSGADSLIVGGGALNTDLSDVSFTSWTNGVDAVTVIGTVFNDDIRGSSQADTMDGKSGADRMTGGKGDDIYRVDNAGDFVNEGAGGGLADRVIAVASYTLTTGASIELLTTNSSSGTAAISLTGNALAQEIAGNAGQNTLNDGGLGKADVMRGFGGDDTYRIFNSGDAIIETSSQGTADRVTTSVDYTLGKGVFVELFSTNGSTGTSAIALTGNEVAQSITGNAGDNRLEGAGGSDTLRGLGGADSFAFASALGADNVDTIVDFNVADDRFLLSNAIFTELATGTLSAAAFRANATGLAEDANDHIVYESDTGKLFYDADGNGAGAAIQFAVLTGNPGITASDFVVI